MAFMVETREWVEVWARSTSRQILLIARSGTKAMIRYRYAWVEYNDENVALAKGDAEVTP
jgi:hypothetical protein